MECVRTKTETLMFDRFSYVSPPTKKVGMQNWSCDLATAAFNAARH